MKRYGICDCGKWGEAPPEFNESIHFLKCTCSQPMCLDIHNPREVGYRESSKIIVTTMKHADVDDRVRLEYQVTPRSGLWNVVKKL